MSQHIIEILTAPVNSNHDLTTTHQTSYLGIHATREAGFAAWCDLHSYKVVKSEVNGTGNHYRDIYIVEPIECEFDSITGKRTMLQVMVGDVKNEF